ncbi:MAG: FecR family protein [Myxococcales bacterium]
MTRCRRVWEVEAERDGRLTQEERESLGRHLTTCADCIAERQALKALGQSLRDLPIAEPDELGLRRRRQELLARAHAEHVAAEQPAQVRPVRAIWPLPVALAAAVLLWWLRPVPEPAAQRGDVVSKPSERAVVVLTPDQGVHYERRVEATREVITVRQGRISLRVRRRPGDLALVLQTPDGEIEDIGTAFAVHVEGGQTRSVEVFEGRVVVRLNGRPPQEVRAMQTYRPYQGDSSPENLGARQDAPGGPGTESAPVLLSAEEPRSMLAEPHDTLPQPAPVLPRPRSSRAAPAASVAGPAEALPSAAEAFALAAGSLEGGDAGRGAVLLEQFLERFPRDPHAEDAAYLRVIALLRLERPSDARAAAHAYLARFPKGFRARDVERVLAP